MISTTLYYIFKCHRPLLNTLCKQNEVAPGNFVAAELFVEYGQEKFFFIQPNKRQFKSTKPSAEHFYLA